MTTADSGSPASAGGGLLSMRSICVGTAPAADAESQTGVSSLRHRNRSSDAQDAISRDFAQRVDDENGGADEHGQNNEGSGGDDDRDASDPVMLPQSTHSLLFTEPVFSLPFLFAFVVMALSFACLFLAWFNGLISDSIPVAVTWAATAVQFLTILVVLLMEEEIPTGLWLLRMIPRDSLHERFPQIKYRKFFLSSSLRILNGYCFLINVIFVIIHATDVLEIFYDVLALQFVQQLDDMAFVLAQKDVLGKAMQRACTAKCFQAEFRKRKTRKTRLASIILKAVYFVNLCVMFGVLGVVSYSQRTMYWLPKAVTVDFGDALWERALVTIPNWLPPHVQALPADEEEWMLLYAFFNGVYERDGENHDGRPVYKERRKIADYSKKKVTNTAFSKIVPAEIKYCADIKAWVFTHENISKFKSAKKRENQGCNWLLLSPQTEEYDLRNIGGDWQVWVGVIAKTQVSITAESCSDDLECNLDGNCIDSKCHCDSGDGVQYFGSHCEVAFRDECKTILGDHYNEKYTVNYLRDLRNDYAGDVLMQGYNRPTYSYVEGDPELDEILAGVKYEVEREFGSLFDFTMFYEYSGNRWFGRIDQTLSEKSRHMAIGSHDPADYHAFWNKNAHDQIIVASDPTTKSTPVGVDLYYTGAKTGETEERFGPFGLLSPMQNQTGRGYFRCSDSDSN